MLFHGCVRTGDTKIPWCFTREGDSCTNGYNMSELPMKKGKSGRCDNERCSSISEGKWDFCTLVEDVAVQKTLKSCHCLPRWEYNEKLYSGCQRIEGDEKPWCYVAEIASGCDNANQPEGAKMQRWDECSLASESPAFLTRHGCHCKPQWQSPDGIMRTSCLAMDKITPPSVMATMNSTFKNRSTLIGWCQVFEDERACNGALLSARGFLLDECFMDDEASIVEFDSTLHGCHCLLEWEVDNVIYQGCDPRSKTRGGGEVEKAWCPVHEDSAACSHSLGPQDAEAVGGAGQGGRRWDWCDPHDTKSVWRHPSKRYTPIEPNPPKWWMDAMNDGKETASLLHRSSDGRGKPLLSS